MTFNINYFNPLFHINDTKQYPTQNRPKFVKKKNEIKKRINRSFLAVLLSRFVRLTGRKLCFNNMKPITTLFESYWIIRTVRSVSDNRYRVSRDWARIMHYEILSGD